MVGNETNGMRNGQQFGGLFERVRTVTKKINYIVFCDSKQNTSQYETYNNKIFRSLKLPF